MAEPKDPSPRLEPPATKHNGASSDSIRRIPSKTRREMIQSCGRLCQLVGLPRSLGQIYGLLYLSIPPLSLDDIVDLLGISKASASTGTRQLVAWGAVRQVWVPGDRRDFFEAVVELGELIHRGYSNFVKPRLTSSSERLKAISASLDDEYKQGEWNAGEYEICQRRLRNLAKVQNKIKNLVPLAEKFL